MYCLTGCGEEEVEIPKDSIIDEGSKGTNPLFEIYHFKDTSNFKPGSLRQANHSQEGTWISGIKKGKAWIGLFSDNDQNQLDEWIETEELPKSIKQIGIAPPIKSNAGYITFGILTDFAIDINISPYQNLYLFVFKENNILDCWDAEIPEDSSHDLHCLSNDYIYIQQGDKRKLFTESGDLISDDLSFDEKNDTITVSYFSNNKLHFLFDNKQAVTTWITKDKFERNRNFYMGYNEYKKCYIKSVHIGNYIKTDWGYAFTPQYKTKEDIKEINADLFIEHENTLLHVPLSYEQYRNSIEDWYNNTLLVGGKYVISNDGKILYEGQFDYADTYESEPISYTEWIEVNKYGIKKCNYKEETIWSTRIDSLDKYPSNSKITFTITNKSDLTWTYRCDILNYDGSKAQENFQVNIETGEITYQ